MTYTLITVKYIRYLRFKQLARRYLDQIALHNKKFKSLQTSQKNTPNTFSIFDYNLYVNECKSIQEKYNCQKDLLSDQYTQELCNLKKQNMLSAVLDDCFKRIKLSNDHGLDCMEFTFENKNMKEIAIPIIRDCGFLVTNMSDIGSTIVIDW